MIALLILSYLFFTDKRWRYLERTFGVIFFFFFLYFAHKNFVHFDSFLLQFAQLRKHSVGVTQHRQSVLVHSDCVGVVVAGFKDEGEGTISFMRYLQ